MAGISPDDTFTYWLPDDRSKPESERRGLVYRHGTAGHWRKFAADLAATRKPARPIDDWIELLLEIVKRGLVGWKGLGEFTGNVEDHLSDMQVIDLADELRAASSMAAIDKKKLLLQSLADAGKSASPASPGSVPSQKPSSTAPPAPGAAVPSATTPAAGG